MTRRAPARRLRLALPLATATAFAALAALASAPAAAQAPGAGPPGSYDLAPPPPPPPSPAAVALSFEEAELLRRGEIGPGRLVTGGVLGTMYGYGIGHAIQGRWSEKGWIFTAGEIGSMVALVYGITRCEDAEHEAFLEDRQTSCSVAPIVAGAVGLIGFRVWEIVDVWGGAIRHNRHVRRARSRVEGVRFYAAPTGASSATGGLSLRF